MPKIFLIDDERNVHYSFQRALGESFRVISAFSGEEALARFMAEPPDVVLLDVKLPGMEGLELLPRLKALDRDIPVILLTAYGTTETAITAMKLGAYDYLLKPVDIPTLRGLIMKALRLRDLAGQVDVLSWPSAVQGGSLLGQSLAMRDLYKMIGRVAPTDMTVLLSGESGTGKELVARAIHQHSLRAAAPWVALNCAAIPELLLESELFEHEKGAFTGASERKRGSFEEASGGTLFLDEAGELSLAVQAKFLRALQEKEIRRLGARESIAVDVRIIAATNKNLEAAVGAHGLSRVSDHPRRPATWRPLGRLRRASGGAPGPCGRCPGKDAAGACRQGLSICGGTAHPQGSGADEAQSGQGRAPVGGHP